MKTNSHTYYLGPRDDRGYWTRQIDRFIGRLFGPEQSAFTAEEMSEFPPHDPALQRIADRVMWATDGLGYQRDDVLAIVHEALWQCAHLVRDGHRVEIPEIGTLQLASRTDGLWLDFTPDAGLLESNHA